MALDTGRIREDFPVLGVKVNRKPVIYFDNACMTLKPVQVVESMKDYYYGYSGCHGRTSYYFGRRTTEEYTEARSKMARLINAPRSRELIFVRNTTEGLNVVAHGLPFKEGDAVLTTNVEHNSNLIPWQVLKRKRGIEHIIVNLSPDMTFDLDEFEKQISDGVKLVSVAQTSNLTGVTIPVAEIAGIAHKHGALVMVDGAQSVAHRKVDVQQLDIDILAFSVHKMLGPTGIGVLWAKEEVLNRIEPMMTGGETVLDTFYDRYIPADIPDRFEAGLQNYAGAIGAGAAADYVMNLGFDEISRHETMLNTILTDRINSIDGLRILGPQQADLRGGIINFVIDGMNALEVARIMDEASNIMVRAGVHCVHSWYNANKDIPDSVRVSVYLYNTVEECEMFAEALKKIVKYYR